MSGQVITDPTEIQTDWLTQVLRRSSALEQGEVVRLEISSEDSKFARTPGSRLSTALMLLARGPPSSF